MKEYDIIVIGSGCGQIVAYEAMEHKKRVALVDRGPTGGTCLNVGCLPSKMLIASADRLMEISEAPRLGIRAEVKDIDFGAIMERMRKSVRASRQAIRRELLSQRELDFYDGEARFVGDHTLNYQGEKLRADTIVIASGSRPAIPLIAGLERVPYLTNETLLELKERPESLIIIGGGYIACEYGHFFSAMGTRVTILEMGDRLIPAEEPEMTALLQKELSKRLDIHTQTRAVGAKRARDGIELLALDAQTKAEKRFRAERLLLAAGRRSNADQLGVEKTGVALSESGYIQVNELLGTSRPGIYAIGDANGIQMFTHVANREAELVADNILHGNRQRIDYSAAPHAVFTRPQIASVGLTEETASQHHRILVGRAHYFDVAGGEAINEREGFAKAVVNQRNGKLLGFHIVGPYASILIQEVINAMATGQHTEGIESGLHIHPALPELITQTLDNLKKPTQPKM